MNKKLLVSFLLVVSVFVCMAASCNTMTSKQQATIFMNTYNAEFDDTLTMAKNPNLTPAQKEIVIKKKEILTQVWPALKIYVSVVDNGGTPSAEDTQAIAALLNMLVTIGGK